MNIKQKFRSSIRRGTGETHLLIKENPEVDFSKEIIQASLFNFAYDQQSEGSRAWYISELISLSPQKDKILSIIYEALKNEESHDDWSTEHLFDIIAIFAKRGDKVAKQTIYECFDKYAKVGDWFGDDAIVEIDGLKGLIYVADKKGEFLLKNPDAWENSFFVDYFLKNNPKIDVYGKLRKASAKKLNIRKYLEEIENNKFERSKWVSPKYDYQYIKQKIDEEKNFYLSTFAAEKVTKTDRKKLANDFLKEGKRSRQQKYLSIFSRIKFPYDYQPILELAKAKVKKTDRLVEFASESLRFFKGKEIRQFALEILPITKTPEIYSSLLIGNYKKGDWRLLKSLAENKLNIDAIHALAISYIEIYEANSTKECKEPLEAIYDKLTCGLHRIDLVRILIENKVLSDKIRNEIQFDSEEGVRKLFVKA